MPLLILLPVLGAVLILRRQLKLSDSLAILCAVSGILVGVYLGALTGFLQGTVYALTAMGVLLLLWEIHRNIKDKTLPFSFPLLLFLVLPVLYWLVHAESKPMFWDEYSHWGIYIREMADTHQLYGAETNASHPDYPPGAPLWQYFFTLLPGYSEGAVYLAQFVLLITPLLVLFEKINVRQWLWIPAILALLALALANFGHGIVSLYTDHILSVWYAGVMLQALSSDKTRLLEIGLLSLPLSVILLIKDAGLPLVVSAVFLMICLLFYRNFREKKNFALNRTILITTIFLVMIPLMVQGAWKLNRSMNEVYSAGEGTGLIQVLLTGESSFSEQEMQTYRQHFWEVLKDQQLSRNEISQGFNEFGYRLMRLFKEKFKLTLLGLLLLFPLWSVIIIYISDTSRKKEYGLGLGFLFLTALAYLFVMYRTYPLIHSVERAQNLVSFLRYAHSVSLPMLFLGMGLLTPAFQSLPKKLQSSLPFGRHTILYGIGLIMLLTFETPYLKPFYTNASIENHPNNTALRWRRNTDGITSQIKQTIGASKLWVHLPIPDNGFLATALRYQLTPVRSTVNRDPELLKKTSRELAKIWNDYDFLWFPVKNQETDVHFQKLFGTINSRLLKVIKEEGQLNLRGVTITP